MLLDWIAQRRFEAEPEAFWQLARGARGELPPAGPLRREVLQVLESGRADWQRIQNWPEIYRHLRSDEALLREELYQYAAALSPRRLQTTRMRRFARTRFLPAALQALHAQVEQAWESYMSQPLQPQERTAETVIGHRLLVEGMAGWLEAIEAAEADPEDPYCLQVAEQANRLLLTVQYQARRLADGTAMRALLWSE